MSTKFSIQEIFTTINGEGPNSGKVTTIIRFAYPKNLNQIHLDPPEGVESHELTIDQIVTQVLQVKKSSRVALMGYDPTFNRDFILLCEALKSHQLWLLLDTAGLVWIPEDIIDYISLSPKPGLICDLDLVGRVQEYRFYWSSRETKLYESNIQFYLPYLNPEAEITLLPKVINQKDIDGVIQYCLDHPKFRANIPLYRTFPSLDLSYSPVQKESKNAQ